jgi:hypothetical protein
VHRFIDPSVSGIASKFSHQRAIGSRCGDQDAAHAAERHEVAAAKTMRRRILIATPRSGTPNFGNIIVRSFFNFFPPGRATRWTHACRREHG